MARTLSKKDKEAAFWLYMILAGLFIASLVTCNLIFRKFFFWEPFQGEESSTWTYVFEQSVGLLPYPITFLITDLISEIFGRRKANQVVIAGLAASLFVLLIVTVAGAVPATEWSPVSDDQFYHVFGQTILAVGSSMIAYLVAQFVDIRIFHFWKRVTKGKHLWLRNNFSTITSQFIDTLTILLLLCSGGEIAWAMFGVLLINGFAFKVLVALLDTPLFYLVTYMVRKRFNLEMGEEVELI